MQGLYASLHMDSVGQDGAKNACLYPWHVQLHPQLHHLLKVGILPVDNLPGVGMIRMVAIWRHGCEFNFKGVLFEETLIYVQMKISGKQKYM